MDQALFDDAGNLTVLIVDDEVSLAEHLAMGLQMHGYQTIAVHSAAEATRMIAAWPEIGVIVADIRMPGSDGLAMAQGILAAREEIHAMEAIIITGHATIDAASAAVRAGVSDFLRKPFRIGEVATSVAVAMRRAQERRLIERQRRAEAQRLLQSEADRGQLAHKLAVAAETARNALGGAGMPLAVRNELLAISHALRTPLNAVAGGAGLLKTGMGEAYGPLALDLLTGGVSRAVEAVGLVEELLRGDCDGAAVAPVRVDLALLAADAMSRFGVASGDVALRSFVSPGEVWVVCRVAKVVRSIQLCLEATRDWAPTGSTLHCELATQHHEGTNWACMTFAAGGAEAAPAPPEGIAFKAEGSAFSRTLESLRFVIARRLLSPEGGCVTAWMEGPQRGAIRIALPTGSEK